MKKIMLIVLHLAALHSFGQKKQLLKGMYLQWGYNLDWYTRSNIHFKLSNGSDFVLHNARAHDQPNFADIYKNTKEITIPQYNYRIGFYLNRSFTTSIEINFDHIKYIVTDGQKVRVTGIIENKPVDGDSILNKDRFLHFEHTDGGNLLHINYARQHTLAYKKAAHTPLINFIWKAGAGINIPRTDFTYHGDRLNNNFHIAGYNLGTEAGARFYFSNKFFLEGTGKTGYVRYLNALANTNSLKGNSVRHGFGYLEAILTIGRDLRF